MRMRMPSRREKSQMAIGYALFHRCEHKNEKKRACKSLNFVPSDQRAGDSSKSDIKEAWQEVLFIGDKRMLV